MQASSHVVVLHQTTVCALIFIYRAAGHIRPGAAQAEPTTVLLRMSALILRLIA
ncbi:hypothetical protein D3C86_1903970 [compost metagenome]